MKKYKLKNEDYFIAGIAQAYMEDMTLEQLAVVVYHTAPHGKAFDIALQAQVRLNEVVDNFYNPPHLETELKGLPTS